MKCEVCDGDGFYGGNDLAKAWGSCEICGGKGRLMDFAIPMFESPPRDFSPQILVYVGAVTPRGGQMSEARRYTLLGARELVKDVNSGRAWFNLKPNCIVRVYLK